MVFGGINLQMTFDLCLHFKMGLEKVFENAKKIKKLNTTFKSAYKDAVH